MEIYLVGGAVRDQLLGLPVHEKDWVVVGGTPQQLLDDGYQQVGKDFPVFLHPKSGEEYALARKERKVSAGYTGFKFEFDPSISLEEDLQRRDLTINAIAQNGEGKLIDPCGGVADIEARTLRHVSDAFIEDPLRVLRVARFHARLHHLGFTIDPKTFELMQTLSAGDELLALAAERVWRELEKGLATSSPDIFINTLYRCGALDKLLPALHRVYHINDHLRDTHETIGKRVELALKYLINNFQGTGGPKETTKQKSQIAWAICCHALERPKTPKNLISKTLTKPDTKHSIVALLNGRIAAPKDHQRLALLTANYVNVVIQADQTNANTLVDLLDYCDAWRRPEQFEQLLFVAECLISTTLNDAQETDNLKPKSIALLRQAHKSCSQITAEQYVQMGMEGAAIGDAIRNARKIAVAALKQQVK